MAHEKKPTQEPLPDPNVEDGIKYWGSQPANYDGVLGGYGNGSLPRVDALGSRQFLMYLLPELCTVPSAIRRLNAPDDFSQRRTRALDVGAGVGRVTADVLLHLFSDVVLVEPVDAFISEALRRGKASETAQAELTSPPPEVPSLAAATDADGNHHLEVIPWKGIRDKTKSVTFVQCTLQNFDPSHLSGAETKVLSQVGYVSAEADDLDDKFDVIWCQWCLGALSDADLIAFFRRCKTALRDPAKGLIVVKENQCSEDGAPRTVFDESDSSLTRSSLAWKKAFVDAGLTLVREEIQRGFPAELYPVGMYALR